LLAAAQPSASDKAAAEALFDDAQRKMQSGKLGEACVKFEQSQRIDPAIGTLLYLADCYERSGRLASAWATFREGASMARSVGQSDRADAGDKRAAALEPRLGKLLLQVDAGTRALEGLVVEHGGKAVNPALYGVSSPVDAGKHQVSVSAPGHEPWSSVVEVKDGAESRLAVPGLVKLAPPVTELPPEAAAPAPAPAPAAPPPDVDTGDGDGQRTLGLVLGGVGLAGVAVGSVFGISAINKNSDAEKLCPRGDVCDDPDGVTLTDDAKRAALASNIAFGVGGAALIAGAVLYLTAPSDKTTVAVAPALGPRGGFIQLGGRF
jgi:serine/threonine-protein kinase